MQPERLALEFSREANSSKEAFVILGSLAEDHTRCARVGVELVVRSKESAFRRRHLATAVNRHEAGPHGRLFDLPERKFSFGTYSVD